MNNKAKKLLFDILTAINNIDSYVGSEKIFNKYDNNPMLQASAPNGKQKI